MCPVAFFDQLSSQIQQNTFCSVRPMRDSDIREFGCWITECDWAGVYDQQTAGNYDVFYEILQSGIDSHFPKETIRIHSSEKKNPSMKFTTKLFFKAKKEHYTRSRVQRHKKENPGEWYKQIKLIANLGNTETNIQPPPSIHIISSHFNSNFTHSFDYHCLITFAKYIKNEHNLS